MYFGRSTQDLGDVSNPRLTVSLFITCGKRRFTIYQDLGVTTISNEQYDFCAFRSFPNRTNGGHPGQLCTYIHILWLKRCVQYAAGHPLLLRLTRRSHPAIWSSPARVIHLDVIQQESQHRLRQK